MTKPLMLFVVLCFILTAYTIYGGTFSGEQLEVRDYIDNYFNNIEDVLGSRDFDVIEARSIKHNIKDIKVNNGEATVEMHVTGVDNTKLTYELIMYHVFIEELAAISNEITNVPNSREVYGKLIEENLVYTRETDLTLKLQKIKEKWKFTDESYEELYGSLRGVRIKQSVLSDKAYENLKIALDNQRKLHSELATEAQFIPHWIEYIQSFLNNEGYVTEFPFEQQIFDGGEIETLDIKKDDGVEAEVNANIEDKSNSEDSITSMEDRLREIVLETIEDMKESAN